MIYGFALFKEKGVISDIKIYYCPTRDLLVSYRRKTHAWPIAEEIIFSTLNMPGAINKEIRREIRCHFYAQMRLVIQGSSPADMDMPIVVHHFLRNIGPEGRTSLPELNFIPYGG